jgi:hypothetical protein
MVNLTSVHSCRPPWFPLEDPSSVDCQNSCSLGPFIEDVGKFNAILTPPSYRGIFLLLCTYPLANLTPPLKNANVLNEWALWDFQKHVCLIASSLTS